MKRVITIILAGMMIVSLFGCTASGPEESSPENSNQMAQVESAQVESVAPSDDVSEYVPEELESSGDIGDYSISINGFELIEDYSGAPAILISYTFTNNGEETANAMTSISERAYQNGVELDMAIIANSDILNADDQMKDIKTGASIDLKSAFLLTSETAPVEFEIFEWISFSDEKIGSIFDISEGGETVLSVAPSGDISGELGDYSISVVGYKISKDYEGKPAIVVTLGYTNHGSDTNNFITSMSCSLFQNGVELEPAIMLDEESGIGTSQMRNVRPGAGIEVTVAYLLTSDTDLVEFEIEEFFSFSGEKIETSFDISK